MAAVVAGFARRRRHRHHSVALVEPAHAGAGLGDLAGELVAEERRHRHLGMAAQERFQIGAAGERGGDADDDLSWSGDRCLDLAIIDLTRFE